MPRLIWSRQALLDVQRLYRFLASKNVDAAKRAVSAVRQGVRVLRYQVLMAWDGGDGGLPSDLSALHQSLS